MTALIDRQTWIDAVRPLVLDFATKYELRFVSRALEEREEIGNGPGHSFALETSDGQRLAAFTYCDTQPDQTTINQWPAEWDMRIVLHNLAQEIAKKTSHTVSVHRQSRSSSPTTV